MRGVCFKRLVAVLSAVASALVVQTVVGASGRDAAIEAVFGKTKFTLNGEPLSRDSLLYDGAAYLPAAYFASVIGLASDYDGSRNRTDLSYAFKSVAAREGRPTSDEPVTKRVSVTFGSPVYYLNGQMLERECLNYDGEAYLPASFLAKALGCSADWNPDTNVTSIIYRYVEKIELNDEVELEIHKMRTLNPVIFPADATVKTVRYVSRNPSVASVGEFSGEITARSSGETVITCTAVNGVETRVAVRVVIPVTSVVVSTDRSGWSYGHNTYLDDETARIVVKVYPENATDKSYTLKAPGITVSDGVAAFSETGTFKLTATASNGVSGSAEVSVINLKEFAAEVVRLTNIERRKVGAPTLGSSYEPLNAAAFTRAGELGALYSHTRPDGSRGLTAIAEAGAVSTSRGENIARGQRTPEKVVDAWLNSPAHRENMLNPKYTDMGVGVWFSPDDGRLHWAQLFIKR